MFCFQRPLDVVDHLWEEKLVTCDVSILSSGSKCTVRVAMIFRAVTLSLSLLPLALALLMIMSVANQKCEKSSHAEDVIGGLILIVLVRSHSYRASVVANHSLCVVVILKDVRMDDDCSAPNITTVN